MINYIVLLILIVIVASRLNNHENFTSGNIIISFPNEHDVMTALLKSNYLRGFNHSDMAARGLTNGVLDHYMNNIDCNPVGEHRYTLKNMVEKIYVELKPGDKKQFIMSPWKFTLFNGLENNFPHTHHDIIFLPFGLINSTQNNRITLVHEKVHVFQKQSPEIFDDLYENYWHFKKISGEFLTKLPFDTRSNPDTLDNNWLFTYGGANIVMLVRYADKGSGSRGDITDVEYIGYDIATGTSRKLTEIPQVMDFFGNNSGTNYYHPYEISADMISYHCYGDARPSKAYDQMKQWWNKID